MIRNLFSSNLLRISLLLIVGLLGVSAVFSPATQPVPDFDLNDQTPLWKVMTKLGKINPHPPKNPNDTELAAQGESLVKNGWAMHNGSKSTKLSNKFTCAACHISAPEGPDLHSVDPELRIRHLDEIDQSFLPGPTFYGLVNRIMFFNDDFLKRFVGPKSDLVRAAHFNIRDAIDACNQVFGQGRRMKEWEKEAILMYFWTMELKIGELKMNEKDFDAVKYAVENNRSNAKAVNVMRNYYLEVYPATLEGPFDPIERRMVSPVVSNFASGRRLYERSCLHCHKDKRYSRIKLDYKQHTFKKLRSNFEASSFSIYDAHRYMPAGKNTQRPPVFTTERLSNHQLQDLRYFISTMARMGDEALDYYGEE